MPDTEIPPEQCPDLLAHLAAVPDPRDRRGLRYALPAVLAVAVCAVLAGAKSLTAIGEWAADAPPQVLVALGVHPEPLTGWVPAPDEATLRCVLGDVDADALDAAIGAWLRGLRPSPPPPAVEPSTPRDPWRAVAVDGKTLRGSGSAGGQVHLLAVADHASRARHQHPMKPTSRHFAGALRRAFEQRVESSSSSSRGPTAAHEDRRVR